MVPDLIQGLNQSRPWIIDLDYRFIASNAFMTFFPFNWLTIAYQSCSVKTPSLNNDFKHFNNSMVSLLRLFR